MGLSSITVQADLIKKDIQTLGPFEADIWFSELVSRIPGTHNLSQFPPIPPTPLMQKVKEDQFICIIGKGGHPKQYSGSEPPFVVAYPLVVKDNFLGIIQVAHTDSQPFHKNELDLLEGLCANAAVAIQVSHQTIIKNWRWEQLSLVRTVSEQIANLVELGDLCQKVTQLIRDTFHYYAVTIFTIESGSEQLHFQAGATPVDSQTGLTPVIAAQLGKGIVGQVAKSGKEIVANDIQREPHYIHLAELPLTKAEAVLPLKVEDRILGVLDIQSDHIYSFHEMDMIVLRSLADNIALAVEGARLYSTIKRRVDQLSIVSEVGKALASILDFNRLLEQIVKLIVDRFEYPFVHLFLVQKDTGKLVYRAGAGGRAEVYQQIGLQYDIQDTIGIIPWVARNGATIIANDVAQEPQYRPSAFSPSETVSEMAVPLIFANEVLGVLDIQSDAPNRFDQEDRVLFETLGDSIAISIRNSILFNSEKWRRQASDSLREVAGLLPQNISLDRLLDTILQELEQILPCEAAAIWLVDEENNKADEPARLKLAAVHGVDSKSVLSTCVNQPECTTWLEQVLTLPTPNVRTAADPYGPLGSALSYDADYSSIAAPMRIGDISVGMITLAHHTPNRYGVESIQMTAAFANYAAVAIQNARLFASAQEQAWIATVLLQVAEATQSTSSIDELLNAVVRLTPMLVGVHGCALFLWEQEVEAFSLAGSHGIRMNQEFIQSNPLIEVEKVPAFLELSITRMVNRLDNPSTKLPFLDGVSESANFTLLPLISRGELMGACLVEFYQNLGEMVSVEAERLAIIQGIAHQTAIAIENIRLLEQQQQETYVSAVLLQVAQTVVSHKDLDDVYAAITQIIPMLVGSDICMLFLWDPSELMYYLKQSVGLDRESEQLLTERPISPDEAKLVEYICIHNQTVTLPMQTSELSSPSSWMDLSQSRMVDPGYISKQTGPILIGVPLGVKDDNYGAMLVVDSGNQARFFNKRMEIISGIAQQTALAIQNEKLQAAVLSRERLEREFQLAREIQQTFLPDKLPHLESWEVEARWRPAREVGGDFYDLFWLSKNQMAIVIADVSDKGISAALYMTLTRTLIRTVAQQNHSPAGVFRQVNELLLRDTPHGMFVTALFGIIDLNTGVLTYANAGHNLPTIWRDGDHTLETLEKGSMPLGIIENVKFVNHEIHLLPRDTILLYTDGITDTFANNEMFGEERLYETIKHDSLHTADSIMASIDKALMEFQGSAQPADDVTALAIYRK